MTEDTWPRGTIVQRKDGRRGPPPYRFKGVICGEYDNPVTGQHGYAICSFAESGCIQIFPQEQLEIVYDDY